MFNKELTKAVEDFSSLLLPVSEKDLERAWIWKDHDGEGIRFAFFVTIQELRQLAVTVGVQTKTSDTSPAYSRSISQTICGFASRDLRAFGRRLKPRTRRRRVASASSLCTYPRRRDWI